MPAPSQFGVNALLASPNAADLYTAILQGYTVSGNRDWFASHFPGFSSQVLGAGLARYRQAVEAGQLLTTSGEDYLLDPGQIARNPSLSSPYLFRVSVDIPGGALSTGEPITVMKYSDVIKTYFELGGTGGAQLAKLLREAGHGSDLIAIAWDTRVTVSIDYIFRM